METDKIESWIEENSRRCKSADMVNALLPEIKLRDERIAKQKSDFEYLRDLNFNGQKCLNEANAKAAALQSEVERLKEALGKIENLLSGEPSEENVDEAHIIAMEELNI